MSCKVVAHLEFCEDCMIAECNGDTSGLSDERAAELERGFARLAKRERLGRGRHIVPSFDSESGEGIREFVAHPFPCAGCGCSLGGARYQFAILGPDRKRRAARKEVRS